MFWAIAKALISAAVIVVVSEVSHRWPRFGALILTLPLVSILAFIVTWTRDHDLANISKLARETLILVPLGLPAFVPLALAEKLRLGFWSAGALGIAFAAILIYVWFSIGVNATNTEQNQRLLCRRRTAACRSLRPLE